MECIKYIHDLEIEIEILEDLKGNIGCDEQEIIKKINQKRELLDKCKSNLSKLSNNQICYRIYTYLLEGYGVNKSIEKVAEENYLKNTKPSTFYGVWNYYKKIKEFLNL